MRNISFKKKIEDAAKYSYADEFIKITRKYDTLIGENEQGFRGETEAIHYRAISKSPIILLDEAHLLDAETENKNSRSFKF